MRITERKLKNRSDLILVPMKDSLAVTVLVLVSAGSKYESREKNGIPHFLEHMCFKGTLKRPRAIDISLELDSIGSQYNAFTSNEFTGYYAKAHPKHLDTLIDVVSDIYLNPVFDPEEIEKEKGVIIEEINMYEDMPHRQVQDIFPYVLYGDTPAGWPVLGPKENVLKMTQEDFIEYRKNNYVASSTKVIVAGKFNSRKIIKKVENTFGTIKKSKKDKKEKVKETQEKPNILIKNKETDQVHLVLGVRTFPVTSSKNTTLKVLDSILGGGSSSRLFHKLREEMGVGYYVRTGTDEYTDHGHWNVSVGADNERLTEVIGAIINELKRLKEEFVSEDELVKAKECLLGNTFLSLESSDSMAEYIGMQAVLGQKIESPETLARKISKVTVADIKKLANEIFVDNKLNLAMIGNIGDEAKIKEIFHF